MQFFTLRLHKLRQLLDGRVGRAVVNLQLLSRRCQSKGQLAPPKLAEAVTVLGHHTDQHRSIRQRHCQLLSSRNPSPPLANARQQVTHRASCLRRGDLMQQISPFSTTSRLEQRVEPIHDVDRRQQSRRHHILLDRLREHLEQHGDGLLLDALQVHRVGLHLRFDPEPLQGRRQEPKLVELLHLRHHQEPPLPRTRGQIMHSWSHQGHPIAKLQSRSFTTNHW